jgi:hypothetical protein
MKGDKMIAIETKYHGPTDTKGGRISASCENWGKVFIPYPHEYSGARAYFQAVLALIEKHNKHLAKEYPHWPPQEPPMIYGGTKDGYVFCFEGSRIEYESPGLEPEQMPESLRA